MSCEGLKVVKLDEVFQEFGLSRRISKNDDGHLLKCCGSPCSSTADITSILRSLMPRKLAQRINTPSDAGVVKKETRSSNYKDVRLGNTYRHDFAQTSNIECESKTSQTTCASSVTIQSDLLGELRNELVKRKFSCPRSLSDERFDKQHYDEFKGRTDAASNTPPLYCCLHQCRPSSRNNCSTQRKCITLKTSSGSLESKRKSSSPDSSILCQEVKVKQNSGNGDRTLAKQETTAESNESFNVSVFHNITSWSQTPFTPAERDSSNSSCNFMEPTEKISTITTNSTTISHYPSADNSVSGDKSRDVLETINRHEVKRTHKYKTNTGFADPEHLISDRRHSPKMTPGMKADIISTVDRCFRGRLNGSRLCRSRSDSVVAFYRTAREISKIFPISSAAIYPQKQTKAGKPTVLWAITKINIYPDDSRTYEVMPVTQNRPSEIPDKSDSVFVLIPPRKEF